MTSYILPARNERFLPHTIRDILKNSKGEIEVIAILEGYWPSDIVQDDRVRYVHNGTPRGMRGAINQGAAIAQGKYIVKIDAHCMIGEGFDLILAETSGRNIIQIPRRKRLDAENWCEQIQPNPKAKPPVDLEFLSYPDDPLDFGGTNMTGKIWTNKILANQHIPIEPSIAFQGSCWHMEKETFDRCGFMDEVRFGDFWQESQELTLNMYLRQDGKVLANKKTEYFHLHKGKNNIAAEDGRKGRGYNLKESSLKQGRNAVMCFYQGEKVWEDQKYPLSHLIEQFPDMPGWTPERIELLKDRERLNGWDI